MAWRIPPQIYTKETTLQILLTNDDGIYAPGIAALEQELRKVGEVCIVAPAKEQSGVGHSITFLSPLVGREVFNGDVHRGWAIEGTPADCVKLALFELCPKKPDLIVSGINGGLNAGINILYSGTLGAAIEGAFFGVKSVAVSLEYDDRADYTTAARMARRIIEQVLANDKTEGQLYNVNIPTAALYELKGVKAVPMGVARYGEHFLKREDPKGRDYYWATNDPPPADEGRETDLSELAKGFVTVTPLDYDMTKHSRLTDLTSWDINID